MTETPQPKWTKYRRTQIAEMIDWTPDFDMTAVSVSDADQKNGSPKAGDKIAHNPANHEDRWLIAADYFAANFEPVAAEEQRHAAEPFIGSVPLLDLTKPVPGFQDIVATERGTASEPTDAQVQYALDHGDLQVRP